LRHSDSTADIWGSFIVLGVLIPAKAEASVIGRTTRVGVIKAVKINVGLGAKNQISDRGVGSFGLQIIWVNLANQTPRFGTENICKGFWGGDTS
jgi:hypothetical protein